MPKTLKYGPINGTEADENYVMSTILPELAKGVDVTIPWYQMKIYCGKAVDPKQSYNTLFLNCLSKSSALFFSLAYNLKYLPKRTHYDKHLDQLYGLW